MILAFLLLGILLLLFLIGPVWYKRSDLQTEQSEENLRLYQERCEDLAQSDMEEAQKQN